MKKKVLFSCGALVLVCACFFWLFQVYKEQGPAILMYHHLAPAGTYAGTPDEENGAILDVERFQEQMAWLAQEGYQTLFMSEAIEYFNNGKQFPPKAVIITFDDGYESNYVHAFPIIQEYGIKINLSPVVMDSIRREMHPDYTAYQDKSLRHLTLPQIKEMVDSGLVELGSHTYDSHGEINTNDQGNTGAATLELRYFTQEGRQETEQDYHDRLLEDFIMSRNMLEKNCGQAPIFFVYPRGEYTKELVSIVKEAGFQAALTTKDGHIVSSKDLYHLRRCNVSNELSLADFQELVSYE